VYSITRTNARVIQAHYEKGKFIIRKTEHISFEKENIDDFKLFLRWIMNIPKGETIRDPPAAHHSEPLKLCLWTLYTAHCEGNEGWKSAGENVSSEFQGSPPGDLLEDEKKISRRFEGGQMLLRVVQSSTYTGLAIGKLRGNSLT
jgi:hypothetical protein